MGAAGLVAALAGRPAHRWYALGLAAAVTLAAQPARRGRAGLAAVVRRRRRAAGAGARRCAGGSRACVPGPVADVAAITVAATLGTAPLMALHFEQVSLAALPANLLAAAGDRADHVARHARRGRGPDRARARRAVQRSSTRRCSAFVEWVARTMADAAGGGDAGTRASPAALASPTPRWRRRSLARARRSWRVAAAARSGATIRAAASARRRRGGARSSPCCSRGVVGARTPRRCPRRARGVVPRHRAGRRDADPDGSAACSSTPGRPDGPILQRLREAGRRAARRARAHPRADRPRGDGAGGPARVPDRGWWSTAAPAGRRRAARAAPRRCAARTRGGSPPTPAR